jgi:hypothetical protein
MAIGNYSQLQTSIASFMDRADISTNIPDLIALAEARLNRLLKSVETDVILTGVSGSRSISIVSLPIVTPISLHIIIDGDEGPLQQMNDGNMVYVDDTFAPSQWAIDGTNIDFDCLLDNSYSFRFRYQSKLALSDASPTNTLLTNHPDVYLAASIMWGGIFIKDAGTAQGFKAILDEFISETRNTISQSRRSTLLVDHALRVRNPNNWNVLQ